MNECPICNTAMKEVLEFDNTKGLMVATTLLGCATCKVFKIADATKQSLLDYLVEPVFFNNAYQVLRSNQYKDGVFKWFLSREAFYKLAENKC